MADELANLCGIPRDAAEKLLQASGGDVGNAAQMHFDMLDGDQESAGGPSSASASSPGPSLQQPQQQQQQQPRSKQNKKQRKTGVATLRDFGGDSDSEEEDETYFAGGKASGQLVQSNPSNKNQDSRKAIANVFKRAQQNGAMTDAEFAEKEGAGQSARSWGRGNRLGDTSEPPREDTGGDVEMMKDDDAKEEDKEIQQERVIRFWQNGFSVDDGPLRRRDDPTHVEFLNSISRGEVPLELRQPRPEDGQSLVGRRVMVHVRIEDNLDKEYTPPKKVFRPFGGGGNTLGSPVPEVKSSEHLPPSSTSATAAANKNVKIVSVDESKPVTKLQIRLDNGTRMVINFNHDHTVGDIRNAMRSARVDGPADFEIRQTMPPRVFEDDSVTLADAKLLQACVVQRPRK